MKVLTNVTIYKCDFCKKELKRKGAMTRHEERCSGNPTNDRPCLNCQNLQRQPITYSMGYGEDRKGQAFFCAAKNIFLLHPKTLFFDNRLPLLEVWANDGKDQVSQEDMPDTCAEYKGFYGLDADTYL